MTRLVPWLGAALFVPFGLWVLRDPSAFVGRCVGMATDGVTGATLRVALRDLGITTLAASALVRESHQLGGRQP